MKSELMKHYAILLFVLLMGVLSAEVRAQEDLKEEMKKDQSGTNPINVAQPKIVFKDNTLELCLELPDQGHQRSRYDLVYKPDEDILKGTYFQAQIQELHNVAFLMNK